MILFITSPPPSYWRGASAGISTIRTLKSKTQTSDTATSELIDRVNVLTDVCGSVEPRCWHMAASAALTGLLSWGLVSQAIQHQGRGSGSWKLLFVRSEESKWMNVKMKPKRQNKCEPKNWPLTKWQMTYGASSILRYWCINLPSLSQNWGDSASKGLPAFIADFFNAMSQRTSPEPRARGQAQFFLNCCEGKGVWIRPPV